jgi:hypothetical protein
MPFDGPVKGFFWLFARVNKLFTNFRSFFLTAENACNPFQLYLDGFAQLGLFQAQHAAQHGIC